MQKEPSQTTEAHGGWTPGVTHLRPRSWPSQGSKAGDDPSGYRDYASLWNICAGSRKAFLRMWAKHGFSETLGGIVNVRLMDKAGRPTTYITIQPETDLLCISAEKLSCIRRMEELGFGTIPTQIGIDFDVAPFRRKQPFYFRHEAMYLARRQLFQWSSHMGRLLSNFDQRPATLSIWLVDQRIQPKDEFQMEEAARLGRQMFYGQGRTFVEVKQMDIGTTWDFDDSLTCIGLSPSEMVYKIRSDLMLQASCVHWEIQPRNQPRIGVLGCVMDA